MERQKPIKPCRTANWNDDKGRWEIPRQAFKKQRAIRKRSKKGCRVDRVYAQRRKWFLSMPENQRCQVALSGLIEGQLNQKYPHHRQTVQIHHKAGRVGANLLNETTWLAVSAEGHAFIHANPAVAREKGWMISR